MAVIEAEPSECHEFDVDQGLDKRRRNRMGDHLKVADQALAEWGLTILNDSLQPLARTPLDRATYGPDGAAIGSPVPTHIPAFIDLVQKVYASFHPIRQQVVETIYVRYRHWPMEQQRRFLKLTDAEFRREKRTALEIVAYALGQSRMHLDLLDR